jgi:hypothetical protein
MCGDTYCLTYKNALGMDWSTSNQSSRPVVAIVPQSQAIVLAFFSLLTGYTAAAATKAYDIASESNGV